MTLLGEKARLGVGLAAKLETVAQLCPLLNWASGNKGSAPEAHADGAGRRETNQFWGAWEWEGLPSTLVLLRS